MKVRIYWNLHKKCYSIVDRKTGRVAEHSPGPVYLEDVTFVVRPAGRERVLRERRKNVHSFVRGSRIEEAPEEERPGLPYTLGYNPYKAGFWYWDAADGEPLRAVDGAALVELTSEDGHARVKAWGVRFREVVEDVQD